MTRSQLFELDPSQRDTAPQTRALGHARMTVKTIDEAARQIHFVCSTGDVDRYGEIVEPDAYRESIPAFMLNPVFPASHTYIGPAGEPTALGHWVKVWTTPTTLEGIAQFDDEDPLAVRYWNLYRKGSLRAVSVGFLTLAHEMREMTIDGRAQRVRVFTKVELLEISATMIPANRAAMRRAASGPLDDADAAAFAARLWPHMEAKLSSFLKTRQAGSVASSHQASGDHVAPTRGLDYLSFGLDDEDDMIDGGTSPGAGDESGDTELERSLRNLAGEV
jgi:hypothetical protein